MEFISAMKKIIFIATGKMNNRSDKLLVTIINIIADSVYARFVIERLKVHEVAWPRLEPGTCPYNRLP